MGTRQLTTLDPLAQRAGLDAIDLLDLAGSHQGVDSSFHKDDYMQENVRPQVLHSVLNQ